MKDIRKVSLVIIGTMIGAGFASGQEIQLFFNQYGLIGMAGMLISCILTGIIIYQTFIRMNTNTNFLSKTNKHTKILQVIISIFLLISYYIMVAGFSAYFQQEWNIPIIVSSSIMAVLCYFTFHKNIQGVISINNLLMPLLIVFVLYLGLKNTTFLTEYFSQPVNQQIDGVFSFKWLFSSVLYASYNSIVLIPMLVELKPYMNTKAKIKNTSILCTVILAVLGICLFGLLLRGSGYVQVIELPLLQIVKEFGKQYAWIYGAVIVTAIFTSAISAGYSFLTNVAKEKKKYQTYVILLCASSIIIAPIGFSTLVNLWYPFFGVLGLVQLFCLFRK